MANLKEGTRRLALLLGAVGAIASAFFSYLELQEVLSQRVNHDKFAQFAGLDVVKLERNCRLGILSERGCAEYLPGDKWDAHVASPSFSNAKRISLPRGEIRDYPNSMSDEQIEGILKKEFAPGTRVLATPPFHAPSERNAQKDQSQFTDQWELAAKEYHAQHSDINSNGLKRIDWSKDFAIESIVTEDGQTVYPTPAPTGWQYLFVALTPVLGFFIPWVTIRAIGWVIAGFIFHQRAA